MDYEFNQKQPLILDYLDWKQFLKEYLSYRKVQKIKPHSLAEVSAVLDFQSKSYLHNLINDLKVFPSEDLIEKMVCWLAFNELEAKYFYKLIELSRAKVDSEKNSIFKAIVSLLKETDSMNQAIENYKYYSNWYYCVVKELICLSDWDGKYSTLAKWVKPEISVPKAKEAVRQLEKLNLIKKNGEQFVSTEDHISSGKETKSLEIFEFQSQMLDLAKFALVHTDTQDREISTISFSLDSEKISEFKLKIQEAQRELVDWLLKNQSNDDRVYQFNWQLFPLSEKFPPRGKS